MQVEAENGAIQVTPLAAGVEAENGNINLTSRAAGVDHELSRQIGMLTHNRCHSAPPGTESTDFDLHESAQYLEHVTELSTQYHKRKALIRWFLLCAVGAGTGLTRVVIDFVLLHSFEWRHSLALQLHEQSYTTSVQWVGYLAPCLGLAAVAGFLVCFVEPLAAGSGIPEIKCYLNGVHLPNVVRVRTLVAKAAGVMCSVAAGLPCGKEGPMIHTGAIIGGLVSRLGNGQLLRAYREDVETRDFVTAGAASGVAAAFGAPVGGVLFAMEEGATHFTPKVMLRTFLCCLICTVTVRFFLGPTTQGVQWGTMGKDSLLSFGYFKQSDYSFWELFIFAFMGVLGGLAGAGFNAANTKLSRWRMQYIGGRGAMRWLEVLAVTAVISSIMFFLPVWSSGHTDPSKFSLSESLFRISGEVGIRNLFHDTGHFDGGLLFLFAMLYYVLACWTYGLGVPSGLFVPSLLAGAAFGRLFGQLVQGPFGLQFDSPHTSDPGVYALMGATAALSGMARITISLSVILMEATGTVCWGLPIFVVTMFAKWSGDLFNIGLYDIHIDLKHVPILEGDPAKRLITMRARDVMSKDVMTVQPVETVKSLMSVMRSCTHNGFPVLDSDGDFVGLIKRETVLQVLLLGHTYGCFQDPHPAPLRNPSPTVPYTATQQAESVAEMEEAIGRLNLQPYMNKQIDLHPYINEGCYTVPEHAALTRVYKLFRGMGLRHLPVVNHHGKACGIITRKDLILADADEHEQAAAVQRISGQIRSSDTWSTPAGGRRQSLLRPADPGAPNSR